MGNIVKFAKPYSFEGTEYTEVDLSGMDKVINGKAKPEYVGPKLKEYTCDILLDAAHGVNPRKMLKRLTQMAEDGEVHYFIIGFAPLSENRFRITDVSESWDAVIKHGLLVQCKVSLTIKEYV